MTRRGFLTTEFWIAVATDIGVIATAASGVLPVKWAAIAATVASVGYGIARGLAKLAPPVVAVAPTQIAAAPPVVPAPPPGS